MSCIQDKLVDMLISETIKFNTSMGNVDLKRKFNDILFQYNISEIHINENADIYDYINMFIDAKKLEGLSQKTLDGYQLELKNFGKVISKDVKDITTVDIRMFLGKQSNLMNSTLSTKLSNLKSFFGWLFIEEIINRDPTKKVKQAKKEKRMIKALTIEELELIRESCKTLRERAMVEVLFATGVRLHELMSLNKDDINWRDSCAKVIGKGNKERTIYFSFKSLYHLKKYLAERNDFDKALFTTERLPYKRLGERAIQKEIKNIAARTDIKKKVHCHVFRHTLACMLLEQGADMSTVQAILGHENISTTQVYAQVTEEHVRSGYKKYMVQ